MNLFLSRVMFSVKKVSFPAKAVVYVFPNLITHVQMMGFESVTWKHIFFYWFQGRNLLVDDQNAKRGGDVKKSENQISRGILLFPFYQSKLMSHFDFVSVIPVFPYTNVKERYPG